MNLQIVQYKRTKKMQYMYIKTYNKLMFPFLMDNSCEIPE